MKFKLVYILHIFIVVIFMASLIFNVWDFNRILELTGVQVSEVQTSYILEKLFYIIHPMIALLGVFIKKPIGWFMIAQYLFFMVLNALIIAYKNQQYMDITFLITMILITGFISLSNQKKTTNFYNIKSFDFIRNNLIAAVIGFGFSMISFVLNN